MDANYKRWNPYRDLVKKALEMYSGAYMTRKYPDPKERWAQAYRFEREHDSAGLNDTADGWDVSDGGELLVGRRVDN